MNAATRMLGGLRLPSTLAFRFLKPRGRTLWDRVFVLAAWCGAITATWMASVSLAGMHGASQVIRDRVSGLDGHVRVMSATDSPEIRHGGDLVRRLGADRGVIGASSQILLNNVEFMTGPDRRIVRWLRGLDVAAEMRVSDLLGETVRGSALDLVSREDGIVPVAIGDQLSQDLALDVGAKAILRTRTLHETSERLVLVVAVFRSDTVYDSQLVLAPLSDVQAMAGVEEGTITHVAVKTESLDDVRAVRDRLRADLGSDYSVTDWSQSNPAAAAVEALQRISRFLLGIACLLGTGFVVCVFVMTVRAKWREICLLLALGLSPSRVRWSLVVMGALHGLLGASAGVVLALPTCAAFNRWGLLPLQATSRAASHVPFIVSGRNALSVVLVQTLMVLLVAIWASRELRRAEPAEVLRE